MWEYETGTCGGDLGCGSMRQEHGEVGGWGCGSRRQEHGGAEDWVT